MMTCVSTHGGYLVILYIITMLTGFAFPASRIAKHFVVSEMHSCLGEACGELILRSVLVCP